LKKTVRVLCAAVFCLVISAGVWGQEAQAPVDETTLLFGEAAEGEAGPQAPSSILPYVLRMFLVLALVLACIYGLYALLKRSSRPKAQPDAPIKILASTAVGPGRTIMVASVGQKAWLLGSTDSAISLIAELDDKELIDGLQLKALEEPQAPGQDFSTILTTLLKPKRQGRGKPAAPSDFFARQRDRLKKF
jgi:flagellar protein FliO/FliZ